MFEKTPKGAPMMSLMAMSPFNISVTRDFVSLLEILFDKLKETWSGLNCG